MDISSLSMGSSNFQLTRAMDMNKSQTLLAGLPSVDNAAISSSLMNQIQDSRLVSARVVDYYNDRVSSTLDQTSDSAASIDAPGAQNFLDRLNAESELNLSGEEDPEDIKTIVDEILARNEELESGIILDLRA